MPRRRRKSPILTGISDNTFRSVTRHLLLKLVLAGSLENIVYGYAVIQAQPDTYWGWRDKKKR